MCESLWKSVLFLEFFEPTKRDFSHTKKIQKKTQKETNQPEKRPHISATIKSLGRILSPARYMAILATTLCTSAKDHRVMVLNPELRMICVKQNPEISRRKQQIIQIGRYIISFFGFSTLGLLIHLRHPKHDPKHILTTGPLRLWLFQGGTNCLAKGRLRTRHGQLWMDSWQFFGWPFLGMVKWPFQ